MKTRLILIAIAMLIASTSAHAFIGQSKTYKVESDFGIIGAAEMVVFPTAFQLETGEVNFYVPFSAIDFTRLENKTITVSVRGKVMTIWTDKPFNAKSLYQDLTRAISGDFLDKD